MTNEVDGRIPVQEALGGLWWCNATYKAKNAKEKRKLLQLSPRSSTVQAQGERAVLEAG